MVTPAGLEAHARDGHFAYGMQVRACSLKRLGDPGTD
jgi:hypothetical protein